MGRRSSGVVVVVEIDNEAWNWCGWDKVATNYHKDGAYWSLSLCSRIVTSPPDYVCALGEWRIVREIEIDITIIWTIKMTPTTFLIHTNNTPEMETTKKNSLMMRLRTQFLMKNYNRFNHILIISFHNLQWNQVLWMYTKKIQKNYWWPRRFF